MARYEVPSGEALLPAYEAIRHQSHEGRERIDHPERAAREILKETESWSGSLVRAVRALPNESELRLEVYRAEGVNHGARLLSVLNLASGDPAGPMSGGSCSYPERIEAEGRQYIQSGGPADERDIDHPFGLLVAQFFGYIEQVSGAHFPGAPYRRVCATIAQCARAIAALDQFPELEQAQESPPVSR